MEKLKFKSPNLAECGFNFPLCKASVLLYFPIRNLENLGFYMLSVSMINSTKTNWLLAFLALILVILFKAGDFDFIQSSLWAEDGKVFLNQAHELGFASLFETYAGYSHLWPRIFALFSTIFSLSLAPYVLFLGWFIACLLSAWSIIKVLRDRNIPAFFCCLAALIILLPPHTDEVYFTVTNAQWIFPIYLSVVMIYLNGVGRAHYALIFISALTGPFSVILSPFVVWSCVLRGSEVKKTPLFLFFFAVLIQVLLLLGSDRSANGDLNTNTEVWLNAIWVFLTFGAENIPKQIVGMLYWSIVMALFVSCFKGPDWKNNAVRTMVLLFGISVFAASLWSSRNNPEALNPLAGGARYYFLPYALSAFFCLLLYRSNKTLSMLAFGAFSIASVALFHQYERDYLYFEEYAKIHEELGGFYVPIHPRWPTHPGWGISVQKWDEEFFDHQRKSLGGYQAPGAIFYDGKVHWENNEDPKLIYKELISCPKESVIGFLVRFESDQSGWSQLFWAKHEKFSEEDSFSVFHDKGINTLIFAVPNLFDGISVRFDPPSGTDEIAMIDSSYVCVET